MVCQDKKDSSNECQFQCISPSCFTQVFGKLLDEEGKIPRVSSRAQEKFDKCWEKEANDLIDKGLL